MIRAWLDQPSRTEFKDHGGSIMETNSNSKMKVMNKLEVKIGIAISAYNRADEVSELVTSINAMTSQIYSLVVCDDGSTDDTVARCAALNVPVITGQNAGIAWNKNRGLYWLLNNTNADTIIIIEDDMIATSVGWDTNWTKAVQKWGHANWADAHYMEDRKDRVLRGSGTCEDPFLAKVLTGCCMAFSRTVLEEVGYLDPRFKGYGFEHIEMSRRLRRLGKGIEAVNIGNGHIDEFYVSISGGLEMKNIHSTSDKSLRKQNEEIYAKVASDVTYREPWQDVQEQRLFLSEIENSLFSL